MSQRYVIEKLEAIKPRKVTIAYFRKFKDCPTSIHTSLLKVRHSGLVKAVKLKRIEKAQSWDRNRQIYHYWVE